MEDVDGKCATKTTARTPRKYPDTQQPSQPNTVSSSSHRRYQRTRDRSNLPQKRMYGDGYDVELVPSPSRSCRSRAKTRAQDVVSRHDERCACCATRVTRYERNTQEPLFFINWPTACSASRSVTEWSIPGQSTNRCTTPFAAWVLQVVAEESV